MIQIRNLKKVYNRNQKNAYTALRNVNLQISKGEMAAIIGKSGAGKSTLIHIMACMDDYDEGEYFLKKKLVKGLSERKAARIRNECIGIVMQDFALVEEFTGLENVMMPLDFSRRKIKGKEEKALEALEKVDMEEMADCPVNELSGGQKQRIAIARAIVNNPDVILADEPTGALDTETSGRILELFLELNREGKTIVIVTHDISIAKRCKRIIEIRDGEIFTPEKSFLQKEELLLNAEHRAS